MAAEAKERLGECERLDLSFFTAGTGNAGPTIVSATFLLLCQEALVAHAGKLEGREPWTEPRDVDFGEGIGVKPIWLLDNPDVPTCHEVRAALNRDNPVGGCVPSTPRARDRLRQPQTGARSAVRVVALRHRPAAVELLVRRDEGIA